MKERVRALLAALVLGAAPSAYAQTPPSSAAATTTARSLAERVGTTPGERLLRSSHPRDRERGLERLGTVATARSLELLVRALDPSGAAQSTRERLVAVRALAGSVRDAKVRECLVRVMTGITVSAERQEPLNAWLRDSAALALAGSGDGSALEALGKALRQPGRVAQSAAAALLAHPPRELAALLGRERAPSPELVAVLEALGDERAFEPLRDIVRHRAPELRARAAVALTRLGNFETVELARHWARPDQPAPFALAAAEILALAHDAQAGSLLSRLLAAPATRAAALELAVAGGAATLEQPLLEELGRADADEVPLLIAALGRAARGRGIERLGALARSPEHAQAAAYALALAPARPARKQIEQLLGEPRSRRLGARAALVRHAALRDTATNLEGVLGALLVSKDAADRAVGAFGTVLLEPERSAALLASSDPVIAQAAARAAPFVGESDAAARELVRRGAGPTRTQLALALVDATARSRVPTDVALELAAEAGPATALALLTLAERDGPSLRARLLEALGSPVPVFRAHVALGLAVSEEPSALGLLENAYRFETDASVRRALVHAIARRPEAARRRALELARHLDPDPAVRQTAVLGLAGAELRPFARGIGTLWVVLAGTAHPRRRAALVRLPGGLAVPVLADPDGVALLAGLPAGGIELALALVPAEDNAVPRSRRDR